MGKRSFKRTIGIDYSGAKKPVVTPKDKKGDDALAVYFADGDAPPRIACPREGSWTRRKIAEWLVDELQKKDTPTLVGIDHAFSFPKDYFQKYNNLLGPSWDNFLDDFVRYWPTHKDDALVKDIRENSGKMRCGETSWLRLTDKLSGSAKSVFHFGIPGQVAPATHAGLPWLRCIRRKLGDEVHFWPFDGWDIPQGKSAIVEVYPALWKWRFERGDMTGHQHDAYSVAGWLSHADRKGFLAQYFKPELSPQECSWAQTEGWILGVLGYIRFD